MGDLSSQRELGRVEQFMLGLLAMPDHTHRLRAIRVKKVFEEIEADYNPTFELLHVAMQGRIATVLFSHASTCYILLYNISLCFSHTHTHTPPMFLLLVEMQELVMSKSLKQLLHIILLTGNFINGVSMLHTMSNFQPCKQCVSHYTYTISVCMSIAKCFRICASEECNCLV